MHALLMQEAVECQALLSQKALAHGRPVDKDETATVAISPQKWSPGGLGPVDSCRLDGEDGHGRRVSFGEEGGVVGDDEAALLLDMTCQSISADQACLARPTSRQSPGSSPSDGGEHLSHYKSREASAVDALMIATATVEALEAQLAAVLGTVPLPVLWCRTLPVVPASRRLLIRLARARACG